MNLKLCRKFHAFTLAEMMLAIAVSGVVFGATLTSSTCMPASSSRAAAARTVSSTPGSDRPGMPKPSATTPARSPATSRPSAACGKRLTHLAPVPFGATTSRQRPAPLRSFALGACPRDATAHLENNHECFVAAPAALRRRLKLALVDALPISGWH